MREAERVTEVIHLVQELEKNDLKHENELKSSDQPLYTQVIDTFLPNSDGCLCFIAT